MIQDDNKHRTCQNKLLLPRTKLIEPGLGTRVIRKCREVELKKRGNKEREREKKEDALKSQVQK